MAAPLLEGDPRQIGGYWLAARLGAGGQGVVYEGYDEQGGRVAVKALHPDAVSAAVRDGLRREVATLQRVASFCTARIIAADLDHFPPYIVSEYVPGPDLKGWVDHNGPYGPDELYRLAIGIATALSSIHRAGVVHRDLKPANVLLGPDGPRVIDFGVAKTDEMSRSATGQVKGTPRWMAPELFRGRRATPAVDVWAWGAIVLYAATGRQPFDADNLPALMHQITTRKPDTSVLGEPLRGFVEAALSQEPDERPAPEEILVGLIGGQTSGAETEGGDPLEAGRRAAAESAQPSMTLPPSLAELAEQVYDELDPHMQQAVPRILLRMVVARPDADDVLCAVPLDEFADEETDQATVLRVLNAFGSAGLLRNVDGSTVAIGTPALLRAWPRMSGWVEAERDGLNAHHVLADAARRWNVNGRKSADLLQGSGLDEAMGWASTGRRRLTLNLVERDFLRASVEQTRHRARTRTIVTAALAALALVATVAGGAAGVQSWNLSKANATVSAQRDLAVGKQVAARAVQLRRIDPPLARRLAVAAASLAGNTTDTHHALLTLSSQWEQDIWQPPGTDGSWNNVQSEAGGPHIFWKRETNRILIVDAAAQRVLRTLNVRGRPLLGMGPTRDGRRLLTLQGDGTLTFWDVATGTARPLPYKHQTGVGLYLSPTGGKLIRTGRGRITVLDSATGRTVFTVKGDNSVWSPTMTSDDRQLVVPLEVAKDRMRLAWWDLSTGKEVTGDHATRDQHPFSGARQLRGTTFSPDGRFLATEADDTITVVETRTREIRAMLAVPKGVETGGELDFSRDGRYIAGGMAMWSTEPGFNVEPHLSYKPDAMCHGTRFSRDGTSLTCVDGQNRIRSIDVSSFTGGTRLAGTVIDSAISQDGTTLAVRSARTPGTVEIWDTASRRPRTRLAVGQPPKPGAGEPDLALSPDGRLLALVPENGTVEVWDVRTRTRRVVINAGTPPPGGRPLPSFSPDGKAVAVLVSREPAVLRFWDTATGRPLGSSDAPEAMAGDTDARIVWSKDGRQVIADPALGVVGFPSGRRLVEPGAMGTPGSLRSVQAISPQGVLATVEGSITQRSLLFWDAATLRQSGAPIRLPEGNVPITAISPDGRLAATADSKGNIDLWDVRGQRRLGLPLTGHASDFDTVIQSLAFSPDGTRVYSVGQTDARLITHIVAPRLLKESLCRGTGQLTREQWDQYIGRESGIEYRETC